MLDNKVRKIGWHTRQISKIIDFNTAKEINVNKIFNNKIRWKKIVEICVLDTKD